MSIRIAFTGGGTAGHVTPNIPLIEQCQQEQWDTLYIGSVGGIEKDIINHLNLPFYEVSSGKLRRYFSWRTFFEPFKIIKGIYQSFSLLRKLNVNIVFSKGGFVAFPIVFSAWLNRIPVIAHESDMSPGLANRLSFPFIKKLCLNFNGAKQAFKNQKKIVVTGTPIRSELFKGERAKGLALCGFQDNKPCLLLMGGGQGSVFLNKIVREALVGLSNDYQLIHLCGKGNLDKTLVAYTGYYQCEYAYEDLSHLFAAADLVISRSGANSLCEILALEKPHILIPLSTKGSRGDQIQNADYFEKQGVSCVIKEKDLTANHLLAEIKSCMQQKKSITEKIKTLSYQSGTANIMAVIKSVLASK